MQFRFRRNRRVRSFLLLILLFLILSFIVYKCFIYTPSNLHFIELNSCPACFGVHLCPLFGTNHVQLSGLMTTITSLLSSTIHIGWQRFSFFNNDMFNIKNIYYGTLNNHPVIFKKMAHRSEWIMFDDCRQHKTSCSHQFKSSLTTLLPCSNTTFISKFRNAFIRSTGLDMHDSEISLSTTLHINVEPIVLSGLSDSGLPIPLYYGACGRVGVVSNEGSNLVSYLHSSFQLRAFLAGELLISMHELNTANIDMIIYYPDVNLENFVYNEYERRVKIIDLEYVIIVERELFSQMNSRTILNPNKFCNTYMSDYNIEQVCRYVLSPSTGMNGGEMSSDFLHNIPENVDREWNLTNVILRCAQTESRTERLALYEKLLDILGQIV